MWRIGKIIVFVVAICLVYSSCFESVDMAFPDNHKPTVIIEALLTDNGRNPFVLISYSTGPNDSVTFIPINNAVVQISDDEGRIESLVLVEPGRYEAFEINGQIGNTYELEVTIEGKNYHAREKLNPIDFEDSTYCKLVENNDYYEDGHYIASQLKFLSNTVSYYKINFYKNDSLYNNYSDLIVFETQYTPTEAEVLLPYKLEQDDTARVEIFSVSALVYKYWESYLRLTNNPIMNSSIPSQNLPSNISGGTLGYFQVSSVEERLVVVE